MADPQIIEQHADPRPPPPYVGVDQFFDEPDREDGRITGMLRWAASARIDQRRALLRWCQWCASAPDAERRVVLRLMAQYEGRVPMGAVSDLAAECGVSRETARLALKRFGEYCPEGVSESRRVRQ